MDFLVNAPNGGFFTNLQCPWCNKLFSFTNKTAILKNQEINCPHCLNKFRLNINETREQFMKRKKVSSCSWRFEGFNNNIHTYTTECGYMYTTYLASPEDMQFKYCVYCGKKIKFTDWKL